MTSTRSHWLLCVGPQDPLAKEAQSWASAPWWPDGLRQLWLDGNRLRALDAPADWLAALACDQPPVHVLLMEQGLSQADAVRGFLQGAGWAYAVLPEDAQMRRMLAEASVRHAWARQVAPEATQRPKWRWVCADCDDADCERHWLARERP